MNEEMDAALAIQLQAQFEEELRQKDEKDKSKYCFIEYIL